MIRFEAHRRDLWKQVRLVVPLLGLVLWGFACHADQDPRDVNMSAAQMIKLPEPTLAGSVTLEEALNQRRSVRGYADRPLTIEEIGQLLWATQGISEPRRGLRTAPSAGATYPLELLVIVGHESGLAPGAYRYAPGDHALLQEQSSDIRPALTRAALNQSALLQAPVTIVISAVHARTEARYGQRAGRYVAMEAGHAAQNLSLQAVALGLGSVVIGAFNDREVSLLLELPVNETPLYLVPVGRPR